MARTIVSCLLTYSSPVTLPRTNVSCEANSRPQLRAEIENGFLGSRQLSHLYASTSGRRVSARIEKVTAALFSPPRLDPSKLSLTFLPCTALWEQRRYTLTHSDLTGQLQLSIGCEFNRAQLSGWYIQLIRDEVLAEWIAGSAGEPELHLFCHISGEERWPAPAALRNYIFRREMPLVLDTIRYGDRDFLQREPALLDSAVYVHLSSHMQAFNEVVCWGTFGDQTTWRQPALFWFQTWWRSRTADRRRHSQSQVAAQTALRGPALGVDPAGSTKRLQQPDEAPERIEAKLEALGSLAAANGRVNGTKLLLTVPGREGLEEESVGVSLNSNVDRDAAVKLSASSAALLEAAESAARALQLQEAKLKTPGELAPRPLNGNAILKPANGEAMDMRSSVRENGSVRERQLAGALGGSSSLVQDSKGKPLTWESVVGCEPAVGARVVRERR